MGSSQSREQDDDVDDHQEDDEDDDDEHERPRSKPHKEKVLEQEPEILPCHPSASPLSPQLSLASTPRLLGPSIKVWDPCNVLLPPPFSNRGFDLDGGDRGTMTEVYLICHGECTVGLRPDLVGGRWPAAGLTGNGERQARALAVLLSSQGVRFSAVYSSPLDRARATAAFVCRELGFLEEQIQSSDALTEMSQGQWEGCLRSDIYTLEMVSLIERTQPDFLPPSGESLRQVEFRMIEFLNKTVLGLPQRLTSGDALMHQNDAKGFSRHSSTNSVQERDTAHMDLVHRLNRPGMQRKISGKSRLQFMTTGENDMEDEFSPREAIQSTGRNPATSIGIFTHATPIKCLLTGILNCSPVMSQKLCVDDSSITVLQHSLRTGWQVKRLNDTAHLRLL
ncbi:uncharacterized protein LOC120275081 [Dioscorea cayenensis subsp. rotundata]|uniref:Uncharacterized protein LOC120275081 n=1 Tax=Dioscorea cayennensis subsp. rotundata TaxID=55577 RepID=A0AB40CC62_DIOCR|nr:uncharacterized protein LOC120275081 [Dioscorea cayenensis subsp. rotundata]